MDEEICLQDLFSLAQSKIDLGHRLAEQLSIIAHVEGVQKVVRKIKQEISTLKNVSLNHSSPSTS